MTTEIKESREPAATAPPGVVHSSTQPSSSNNTDTNDNINNNNRSHTTIPPSLLQNNPHGHTHHHHRNPNHSPHHHHGGMMMPPHSPKSPMSRKQQGLGNVNMLNRPRSHSLGTAYAPLLMPQTPPPSLRGLAIGTGGNGGGGGGQQRSLSLSPNVYRSSVPMALGGGPKVPISNRMEPPRHNDTQKIMENEQTKERQRAKKLELEEQNMTADELRQVLKRERYRMSRIAGELAKHKSLAVQNQADAEICEEGRINCLMRRLDDVQIEKGRIIVQLEQEEEMLTNTLQKKLDQVRREKAQLERLIETEKLSHTNLQSTLTGLTTKKDGKKQPNKNHNNDNAAGGTTTIAPPPPPTDNNNSSLTPSSLPSNGNTNQPTVTAIPASLPPPMDSLAESPDEEDDEDDDDDEEYPGEGSPMEGTASKSNNDDGVVPMET